MLTVNCIFLLLLFSCYKFDGHLETIICRITFRLKHIHTHRHSLKESNGIQQPEQWQTRFHNTREKECVRGNSDRTSR